MKRGYVIGLVVSCLLLWISTPVGAAQGLSAAAPPLPEWPIIGPILRLIGVTPSESTPAEDEVPPTPTPDLPTYRPATIEEGWDLWKSLESGEQVRVVVAEADVDRALQEEIAAWDGVREVDVTFDEGELTLMASVDRRVLEDMPVDVPFLPRGETLRGEVVLHPAAEACRLDVDVVQASVNGRTFLLRYPMQRALDALLDEYWSGEGCLQRIVVTAGTLTVDGYK